MDNASPEPNETEEQEAQASATGDGPNVTNGQNIAPPTAEKKWYIVNTYSGHENKAKLTLLERVKTHNLTDYFGDILVPTESVTENVKGQRRTMTRKFFPGYMFVQMVASVAADQLSPEESAAEGERRAKRYYER
jgi:hypothetical protein